MLHGNLFFNQCCVPKGCQGPTEHSMDTGLVLTRAWPQGRALRLLPGAHTPHILGLALWALPQQTDNVAQSVEFLTIGTFFLWPRDKARLLPAQQAPRKTGDCGGVLPLAPTSAWEPR